MEKKITKKETLKLLRMMQRFQMESTHSVSINVYHDEGGKLWFTCDTIINGKCVCGRCYEWDTFENNLANLENYMKTIKQ